MLSASFREETQRVVTIASGLNKDLDKYISNRRASEERSLFSKPRPVRKPKEEERLPNDLRVGEVRVVDGRPGIWERIFGKQEEEQIVSEDLSPEEMARLEAMETKIQRVEREEVRHPERIEELEEEREGLLQRFFGLFRGYEREHQMEEKAVKLKYVEEEVIPQIDEDVKRVLKIIHKWLNRLPTRVRDEFKKSNDFREYKELLEKYGVARHK